MTLSATGASREEILLSWVEAGGLRLAHHRLHPAGGQRQERPLDSTWSPSRGYYSPGLRLRRPGAQHAQVLPHPRDQRVRERPVVGSGGGAGRWRRACPANPGNVGAAPFGDNAVGVYWSTPADDNGSPITQYEAQWSADGSTGWKPGRQRRSRQHRPESYRPGRRPDVLLPGARPQQRRVGTLGPNRR